MKNHDIITKMRQSALERVLVADMTSGQTGAKTLKKYQTQLRSAFGDRKRRRQKEAAEGTY